MREADTLTLLKEHRDRTRRFWTLVSSDTTAPGSLGLISHTKLILRQVETMIRKMESALPRAIGRASKSPSP